VFVVGVGFEILLKFTIKRVTINHFSLWKIYMHHDVEEVPVIIFNPF